MGWPVCNSTLEDMRITEKPLFDSHDFTFHQLTLAISAVCGVIAIVVSLLLMFMHAIRYSRPKEQRHIIRILFMVPIYALVSFLSIVFYTHSVYYEVLRDCYEAFAIASFFSLMCGYIAEDLHAQKQYFRSIKPKNWIWPMKYFQKCAGGENGWLRTPRSGLTWFNVIWVAVFQYCFIRVAMTIIAVITQYFDRYCLESLNPAFSHIWVMVIEGIAVTITMYCIIQFYYQIKDDIFQHKPILKVLAIKLVIFLSFWQTILISLLTSSGSIKATDRIQTPDIKVGIPSMLLCVEMALFAIFHWWSFSYKPYVIGSQAYQNEFGHLKETEPLRYRGGPLGLKAVVQCFNPWDLIKATGRSAKWLFRDRKYRQNDSSYSAVNHAQKMTDLSTSTSYNGAAPAPVDKQTTKMDEEQSGLLNAPAPHATQVNPFSHEDDSPDQSPWTEVESKEYFQHQPQQPQTHYLNPYDNLTRYHPTTQEMATTRPLTDAIASPNTDRTQHLPFVTRSDIEDLRQTHGGPGQLQGRAPYPRSMASVSTNQRDDVVGSERMPRPPGRGEGTRP